MYQKFVRIAHTLHPQRIVNTFPGFLRDEAISGKLILIAVLIALLAANTPLRQAFDGFWHSQLALTIGGWSLSLDLRHWINEGLMAIFFLVVGLEIKHELVHGELQDTKRAILPIAAAVGGMLVPAILYASINLEPAVVRGWGIPIATDIAFAVAILSLLSNRIPRSLKLFLLTLAIADDIGAILVIALFYATVINYWFLALSVLLLLAIFAARKWFAEHILVFMLSGALLWLTVHLSGIHASIVGAAVGLIAPVALRPKGPSISRRLERFFLPISTFIVVPLFALANTGIALSTNILSHPESLSIIMGIVFGLVLGKMIGITAMSWLVVRLGYGSLPSGTNWRHIVGVGFIAGIGFTVSIFITELAFRTDMQLIEAAKAGIFIASIISAVLGIIILVNSRKAVAK